MTDEEIARLLSSRNPYAEPRPKLTDADIARMLSPQERFEIEGGPGAARSYARGLAVEGPSQVAGGIGSTADALVQMGARLGFPGAEAVGDLGAGESFGSGARAGLERLTGLDEPPRSRREKTAEKAGTGTAFGVLAAPLALSAAGPGMAATEVGLATLGGATGEEARQVAEERGGGGLAQGGAEIAGDLLMSAAIPGAIIGKGPKIAQGARNMAAAYRAGPEVQAIADRLGVPVGDLVRESGNFKRFVPQHPSGDERYVDEWAGRLGEAIERFPDPNVRPTTRQVIDADDDAGASLASLEEGLGRADPEYDSIVGGRKKAATDVLREEFNTLRPEGSAEEAITAFDRIADDRWAAVDDLWRQVPREEMPMIPTERLKEGARESMERAGEFAQDVPDEVARVLDWPEEVPWEQYQRMRSRMLRTNRIARRSSSESVQHKADNLGPALKAFNDELDTLASSGARGSDAYKRALGATRKYYEDFDPQSVAVKALGDYTEARRIVSRLKGAKKPVEEARRLRRIYEQEPGGLDSVRRMFFDDLIGPDELNPNRAKRALRELRKNENVARELMGDETYDSAVELMDKARMVSVGKTGQSAQAMSVGSGAKPLDVVMAGPEAFVDPAGAASKIVRKLIGKSLRDGAIPSRILREASLDPVLAKTLLEMPTPRSVNAWAVNWKKLVNRSMLRAGARQATSGETP